MRNGSSGRIKTIGGAAPRKRIRASVIRAAFSALLLAAAALSALAVHLATRLERERHPATTANSNSAAGVSPGRLGGGGAARGARTAAAAVHVKASHAQSARQGAAKQPPTAPVVSSPEKKGSNGASAARATAATSQTQSVDDGNAAAKAAYAHSQKHLPYPDGPKTDPKYAKDRVYCMVPFVWNAEMYTVIMQTWGKRCNVIHFLADAEVLVGGTMQGDVVTGGGYKHHSELPAGTFPENVIFVNMTRPWRGCTDPKTNETKVCRHIWEKMWRSWVYVGDHHLDDAEWFCKVDYDTFFFPENLQYYVRDQKGWNAFTEHHYFGHVLYQHADRPPFAAGAAACWSRKTLEGIVDVYKNMPKVHQGGDRGRCEDRAKASEELGTSMCLLKGLNVSAEPMVDEGMREYVTVDPVHNVLTWNRTEQGEWWYWKGKPKNRGQLDDCCSVRPMGFHKYKKCDQIERLDQQFYGPANNKALEDIVKQVRNVADKPRVRKYFGRVRTAMGIDP